MKNGANLPKITPQELSNMLRILDNMENPPALMVYGPPGIGKTSILKEFAESRNYELRVKHLSRMDTTDWSGIPKMDKDQKYAEFLPISLFKKSDKKIVIFFDELNTAMPQVLNAALDVILEKKADSETFSKDAELPKNTIILAAGNLGPEEDGTYVEELSMAVKTRMIQVILETDLKQWILWAKNKKIHKKIIGYMNSINKLIDLNEFKSGASQAPTPRGWERLSDIIYEIEKSEWISKEDKKNLIEKFSIGTVGEKRGKEFSNYYCDSQNYFEKLDFILPKLVKMSERFYPAQAQELAECITEIDKLLSDGLVMGKEETESIAKVIEKIEIGYLTALRGKKFEHLESILKDNGYEEAALKLKKLTIV